MTAGRTYTILLALAAAALFGFVAIDRGWRSGLSVVGLLAVAVIVSYMVARTAVAALVRAGRVRRDNDVVWELFLTVAVASLLLLPAAWAWRALVA